MFTTTYLGISGSRVARFLLVKFTKTGKKQITTKLPIGHKMAEEAIFLRGIKYQHFPVQGPPKFTQK
jgi:hypothetical protein